ncbi:MAG: BNR-4 repeat-containing protein [Phycisphaerales bacterium JB039]
MRCACVFLTLACAALARAQQADHPLIYEQNFQSPGALAGFRFTDPDAWRLHRDGDEVSLAQFAQSDYHPPYRSPHNIALLPAPPVGSFMLEADLTQTGRDYGHRDMCLFFNVQAPDRFCYAHLARDPDATAHHIMLVDGADRRPITTWRSDGVDWTIAPRRVRLAFDAETGAAEVTIDGQRALAADAIGLRSGFVGFGTFDDEGRIDNIRLWADSAGDALPQIFQPAPAADWTAGDLITLNDDGGWCWFEGERAIAHDGALLVGTVAAGARDPARRGDIELTRYDLATGATGRIELHDQLQLDDHNSPALLALPDDRILAVWAKHGPESRFYWRMSAPNDPTQWSELSQYEPSTSSRITYSNTFRLSAKNGRIYNFFRGLDGAWKPSYVFSDDNADSWQRGAIVIDVPTEQKHRPYVRYASDGDSRIHLLYTEGHPRNYDNSVYHIYYEDGALRSSAGDPIAPLNEGLQRPELGTRVYSGDADNVAWVTDLRLDDAGRPVALYSVQVGSAGLPPRQGGDDHRYRSARWDGAAWQDREIAFAGSRLYAGEDDYTGLGAIDPRDTTIIYISTNADPATGAPLISSADSRRHWEIYKGAASDDGGAWSWTPLTRNSTTDNIRPVAVAIGDDRSALLWLRGAYRSYTDYDLAVVALLDPGTPPLRGGSSQRP